MFRKPSSVESVAEFLSALRKSLRWRADREKIEEIAAEAEAHLSDRIEALTAQGMEISRAEQAALAGFGDPREFAASVADGVVDTRLAQVARAFALGGTMVLCGFWLWMFTMAPYGLMGMALGIAAVILFALPLAAFLGRRPQTRTLALCLGVTAILGTILSGIYIAPVQDSLSWRTFAQPFTPHDYLHGVGLMRKDYSQELAAERRWRDRLLEEQALVRLGKAAYATPGAPVPPELRIGDGYLVPLHSNSGGDDRTFLFRKELTNAQVQELIRKGAGKGFDHEAVMSKQPLTHVYTYEMAVWNWQARLARLESGLAENLARRNLQIEQYRRAMTEPWRFNTASAVVSAWASFFYGLFFLGLDIALSLLGRLVYLLVRNLRRGPNPTTAG